MKTELSSFDVLALVKELQILNGARINKVYQLSAQELKVQLNIKGFGRGELVIEAGRRAHLTQFPKPSPEQPSGFAMALRKYLGNAVVKEVRQIGFDRIVEIGAESGEGSYKLIVELFGKGNVVLSSKENRIIAALKPQKFKDRDIVPKAIYAPPPQRVNPLEITSEEIKSTINDSKLDLVRALATKLGLGGLYAEEVCLRSGIPKNKKGITEEEAEKIFKAIKRLKEAIGTEKPTIVFENSKPLDAVPLKLKFYEGKLAKECDSFNSALDEYFTKCEIESIEETKEKKFREAFDKLKLRLKEQAQSYRTNAKAVEEQKKLGDLIYANFKLAENILSAVSGARKTLSWGEIEAKLREGKEKIPEAKAVKKLLPKDNSIVIDISGIEVALNLSKSVSENAEAYYSASKKAKEKLLGLVEAINATVEEIKKLKQRGKEAFEVPVAKPRRRAARQKEWYEKFRWFFSSDGFLVLGGRDATSNEVLVKRHMNSEDIFVHADIHGAPAVVIKSGGKPVPEATIQEAFDFGAAYSKAWKHAIAALEVYWVAPEQVSKTPEHGEFVAKGAFIIRGKKNFGRGKVEVAIGVKIDAEAKVIGGPKSAIEKHANYFVTVVPGRKASQEVAEEIKKRLAAAASTEEKEKIEAIDTKEIQEFLPGGGSEVR